MVRKLILAAATAALATLPIAGQAASPPPRVAAEISGQNEELVGLVWQYVIVPVILAALVVLLTGGGDEEPESP